MSQCTETSPLPSEGREYADRIRLKPTDARYLIYLLWNGRVDNFEYVRLYTQVCEAWWATADMDDGRDASVPKGTLDALRKALPVIEELAVEFSKDGRLKEAERLASVMALISRILHRLDDAADRQDRQDGDPAMGSVQAFRRLRDDGVRIRRLAWGEDVWIMGYVPPAGFILHEGDHTRQYSLTLEDILAEDWAEVGERCSHGCASWSGRCAWTAGTACTAAP